MDIEVRQDRLEDRQLETERRQYAFEKEMAEFRAEIRMYINKTDKAIEQQRADMEAFKAKHEEDMRNFEAALKASNEERRQEFRSLMSNAFTAWAVGIIAIVVAIFMSVKG